jgi:hypothetical protein
MCIMLALIKQTNILRNVVDLVLCDILKEGRLTYFMGGCMSVAMLRIREQEGMERYNLLIDEQLVIGWDNFRNNGKDNRKHI